MSQGLPIEGNGWTVGEPEDGCFDVTCDSWLAFMAYVDAKHKSAWGRLYRGQRKPSWAIESRLLRETRDQLKHKFPDWNEAQIGSLAGRIEGREGGNVMQSYAAHFAHRDNPPVSDIHAWMVGRHQGLFTPFVDWSRSPYVAAFHAAADVVVNREEKLDSSFAVYSVSSWLFPFELSDRASDNARLPRHALKVDAAFIGNPRGIAQQAMATYIYPQVDVGKFVAETSKMNEGRTRDLERILVPFRCAPDALIHLNRMNINFSTLYPDAFGLAQQANMNLLLPDYEGRGNWSTPPGFDLLIPKEAD